LGKKLNNRNAALSAKTSDIKQTRRLVDFCGRTITYLRVSLTQKCNLRCGYCFGSVDKNQIDKREMTNTEILRLIQSFVSLGINKVRFTGGEPLLRRAIADLVKGTSALPGISIVGLTTNGLLLNNFLPALVNAGLNRINISLDSLDRDAFRRITGIDGFQRVLTGIENAENSGAFPWVKINTVVMRGINDSEIPRFAEWALSHRIDIRFIEFMPTENSGWDKDLFMAESEIREKIGLALEEEVAKGDNNGPARRFRFRDYPGRVSFISAASRSFCNQCNRLRLTSRGDVFGCLFQNNRAGLKKLLEIAATGDDVSEYIVKVIARPGFRRPPGEVSITEYEPYMQAVGG